MKFYLAKKYDDINKNYYRTYSLHVGKPSELTTPVNPSIGIAGLAGIKTQNQSIASNEELSYLKNRQVSEDIDRIN